MFYRCNGVPFWQRAAMVASFYNAVTS